MIETIEHIVLNIPMINRYYRKKSAKLKRRFCLLLQRFDILKPFTFVQWLATYKCNLHCPYCEASAGIAAENELSTEEVKRLIDDLGNTGVKRFLISGGEPLLRPDLTHLMEHASLRDLKLGLVTNGFLVENRWNDLRHFKYFLYFTSIDGIPEYSNKMRGNPDAFEKAIKGLELFSQLRVPVRIVNTVVHPGNIDQLGRLMEILRNSAATWWRLSPIARIGRATNESQYNLTEKQLRYVADFIRRNRNFMNIDFGESHAYLGCFLGNPIGRPFFCGAGLTRCSVMPDGEVLGCQQVYDRSLSEGNIRNKPFPQIWKEGFSRFRKRDFPVICRGCAHLSGCQAGCWAEMEKQGVCLKSVLEEKI